MDGGWNRFAYAEGSPLLFTDPEGLEPDGHHWVIGPIRHDPDLSKDARDVFRNAKTGWYGERHGWDKGHSEYNKAVKELWDRNNYNKPCMTRAQAEDFVQQIKTSGDPRIVNYRNFIYNKVLKWAFRRMPGGGRGPD